MSLSMGLATALACEPGVTGVTVEQSLSFGRAAIAQGRGGVVVVPLTGHQSTSGELIHDGRGETGLVSVCGAPNSTLQLTFSDAPLPLDVTPGRPVLRVQDFELRALGVVLEKKDQEEHWTLSLGASGRAQLEIGGTLVVPNGAEFDRLSGSRTIVVTP